MSAGVADGLRAVTHAGLRTVTVLLEEVTIAGVTS
jgi:hypothetical protein